MKLVLIISALLFSGFTFANTPESISEKASEAKATITNKMDTKNALKENIAEKKEEVLKEVNVDKAKSELSKLKKTKEAATEL